MVKKGSTHGISLLVNLREPDQRRLPVNLSSIRNKLIKSR